MISNQNIFVYKVAIVVFVAFTPFTFLYLLFYIFFLFTFFFSSRFCWCWISIEIIILLFMGISYTIFSNSFSNLLLYFLFQAFSSFSLLVFYLLSVPFIFTLSVLLKLSLFPFHSWFISVVYSFPNFTLFLTSTLHKLPIFIMFILYPLPANYTLLWFSILINFVVSGVLMLFLVLSSVGNNSWLFLRCFSGMITFMIFIAVYFTSLIILFISLGSSSKPYLYNFHQEASSLFNLSLVFISLSGLPPFPLFFSKMYVIYTLFNNTWLTSTLFFLVVFSRSFLLIGYLSILIKNIVYSYSTFTQFIFSLKY